MSVDNRSLVLIMVALATASLLAFVPSWTVIVAGVLGLVIAWQRDREQTAQEDELEAALIREHVPELAGMDIVQRAAYSLDKIDEFKAKYGQDLANLFATEFQAVRESYALKGETAPDWMALCIPRRVERDFLDYMGAEKSRRPEA